MHEWKDFKVLKKLGGQKKRKFGSTYLIQRKDSEDLLVLKVVEHSSRNVIAEERLKAESNFSFSNEALPKVIDFQSNDSESWLILKYKEGVPLDEYFSELKRKEKLPFLKNFVSQLVPIFSELREKSIAHCDIKPSNFLVSENGVVHLIDFGLAINFQDKNQRKLVFPLGYAAPELVLNQLDLVNQQTDFYALGTTIWRLFSGKMPLTHPNPSIFTNLQLNHPLPENDAVPKKLQKVLEQLTIKHSFAVPPNRMAIDEARNYLLKARDFRPSTIEEIDQLIQEISVRRRWF